jgi:hypothetical protein
MMGWNIVESAGRYFPVRQGEHLMSAVDAENFLATIEGFATLRDAMDAVIQGGTAITSATERESVAEPKLFVEGYLGFNVVSYGKKWYGIDQSAGNLDIGTVGELAIEEMKRNGMCVTGESCADVKAEIFRLILQTEKRRLAELSALITQLTDRAKSQFDEAIYSLARRVSAVAPESDEESQLLEEGYRGFNLVAYDRRIWAIEMSTGPIDLRDAAVREPLIAEGRILAATTLDGVRLAVDHRVLEERVRALESCLDEVNAVISELKVMEQPEQAIRRKLNA